MKENKIENMEQKQNEDSLSLGLILDKARDEVGAMVLHYMNTSGIPASIFDYVLADIISKVKELKASEYTAIIGRGEKDGEHTEPTE